MSNYKKANIDPALAKALDSLVDHMNDVAKQMVYFGGFNQRIQDHAEELKNAANTAATWAEGIREDYENCIYNFQK